MLSFDIAQGGGWPKNLGTVLIVRCSVRCVNSPLVSQVILARIVAHTVILKEEEGRGAPYMYSVYVTVGTPFLHKNTQKSLHFSKVNEQCTLKVADTFVKFAIPPPMIRIFPETKDLGFNKLCTLGH